MNLTRNMLGLCEEFINSDQGLQSKIEINGRTDYVSGYLNLVKRKFFLNSHINLMVSQGI